ncbi:MULTISPECIES: lipocalin family protein [unclassified Chitinophaga]|uniref:lipocalin family protein n=1 Tax=unclassified Chitinophaga TaxID=2619133 RepID=UPI0009CD09CF|nr:MULTISPECIES: lipocalin family protein [unclassified Chitinophaga]OMP78576.1 lipocalin [[Flexibacter] sp. ATCC 35208]WPV64741.1 lipocalin family protein [Chitinophaga sp. LS1]
MSKPQKFPIALLAGAGIAAGLIFYKSVTSVSIPRGAKAVSPFDAEKYLGKWYEIARLDYKFEKNLNNVTATYSKNENGSIRVDNKGFNYQSQEWKESVGKARFVNSPEEGRLKVSFFGPFYAGYNVIALDADYQYALVAGDNLNYMWILSRETTIPDHIKENYLEIARQIGFDTSKLIWTDHSEAIA